MFQPLRQHQLKTIRVVVSLVFFCLLAFLFLDFARLTPSVVSTGLLSTQFVPSLLLFLTLFSIAASGFLVVLVFTLLFGRVYCSTLCPLGTLQDIVSRLAERFKKQKKIRFRYTKPYTKLRYGILLITVMTFLSGHVLLVNLLDPFSQFGRIFADLIRPFYIWINNLAAQFLPSLGIYTLYPVDWHMPHPATLMVPLAMFGIVIGLSVRQGRLFCNTLCPLGTLLGFVAKFSLFKIKINDDACTRCAHCVINCKASCIHLKTKHIDSSRCVGCFNCLAICPGSGIGYQLSSLPMSKQSIPPTDLTARRLFLSGAVSSLITTTGLNRLALASDQPASVSREAGTAPVAPPGARSIRHFNETCTACHLCVSACPTHVLQPAFLDYGLTGLLQPHMDYHTSFCNFDCTVCGQICPTGAILPLSQPAKHVTQLGIAKFLKELCIVYTDQTACGACAEPCPTKAVDMVSYQGNLTIPAMTETLCIGCGACEYACPVRPERAIYVASNPIHRSAEKPQFKDLEVDLDADFPF